MDITEVKIRRTYNEGKLRALVSITLDNDLAIHDIKVIEGPERYFIAMPSRQEENGVFRDVVHPINVKARRDLEDRILGEYYRYKEELIKQENLYSELKNDRDEKTE
ncbi:MAG: septation regulator SpoVG [Oscillospiraceae bacterium]|jgi:stage V sporulation protein G|nr:septation regulator SpoVG [Oscillospiraceae bacterium]